MPTGSSGKAKITNPGELGEHSNPRRYESDYGFVSAVVAVGGAPPVQIWAVGLACVENPSGVPADGRTAGNKTTVYHIEIENPDAAAQTLWLEDGDGNVISVDYNIATNDTLILDFPAGKTYGDMDLYINGSVATLEVQISGTEI